MTAAHSDFPRHFATLSGSALFCPWTSDVLRASAPRWISKPYRFTGAGAFLEGGRWNPLKLIPAVYLSNTVETLNAEAEAWAKRYGWKIADLKPQTRIALRLELQAVLDLTSPATLSALGLTVDQFTSCPWKAEQDAGREALTQAIGRAAFEHMAEGLVVPSAQRPGGVNIVLFPVHRRDGSRVITLHEADIPHVHGLL